MRIAAILVVVLLVLFIKGPCLHADSISIFSNIDGPVQPIGTAIGAQSSYPGSITVSAGLRFGTPYQDIQLEKLFLAITWVPTTLDPTPSRTGLAILIAQEDNGKIGPIVEAIEYRGNIDQSLYPEQPLPPMIQILSPNHPVLMGGRTYFLMCRSLDPLETYSWRVTSMGSDSNSWVGLWQGGANGENWLNRNNGSQPVAAILGSTPPIPGPAPAPEPSVLFLLGSGITGVLGIRMSRNIVFKVSSLVRS